MKGLLIHNINAMLILFLIFLVNLESNRAIASRALKVDDDHQEEVLVANHEKKGSVVEIGLEASLPRGQTPPSESSGCTYISGSGGSNCPLGAKNFATSKAKLHDHAYPRLMVSFGVATYHI